MVMDRIALILTIIGGINWGSVGLFRFDIVAWLFGGQTATVSRVVYTLVGLSALWCVSLLFRTDYVTDDGMCALYRQKRAWGVLLAPSSFAVYCCIYYTFLNVLLACARICRAPP